jgi:hypothetical protein
MTGTAELIAKVVGGKLPSRLFDDLNRLAAKLDGKTVLVSIREQKRRRSSSQNSYYWGCVVPAVTTMFRDAGNFVDHDDVHEFLKLHVGKLKQNFVTPEGEVLSGPASSAKLTTTEFEPYMDRIRAWAAECGCMIGLPNEQLPTEAEEGK